MECNFYEYKNIKLCIIFKKLSSLIKNRIFVKVQGLISI